MDSRACHAGAASKKSLIAAAWLGGKAAEWIRCDDPTFPADIRQHREYLGCHLPADDYPEAGGGDNCPDCRPRHQCETPGHGKHYVGRPGFGFRTDRCPKTWASTPFVGAVLDAYAWSEKPGAGAFGAVCATPPSFLLEEAVLFYTREVNARFQYEMEQDQAEADAK